MSAWMISELAGACRVERLLFLAGITVSGGFFISVLTRLVRSKCTLQKQLIQRKSEAYFTDVQNNLQYEHLENTEVVLLRSKIDATIASGGGGLELVKQSVQRILSHVLNIIFSVALTLSVFTCVTEGEFDGFLALINSPASGILLIAVIALNTVLTIRINLQKTLAESRVVEDRARTHTFEVVWGPLGGHDVAINGFYQLFIKEFRKYLLRPAWVEEMEKVKIRYGILSIVLNAVMSVILFVFVAAKAFIGAFGIGNFLLYQGTTARFIGAVSGLASEFGKLRHNNVYLEELYTFLDLPNDMYKGSLAVARDDDNDYEIEFRDVSFKYPRTENWVLRHVNMKFRIGDKLAIVGENGSGKTTFIKLLCRLYDPTEGKILLNGIDITQYRYDEYLALFSVVFQDFTLFAFSLGENVAADCTYDPDKVRDCLIRVGMGEKLASLDNDPQSKEKDGLKRSIGKDYDRQGVDFSGGEKQKIALARALYKDA
ncbi:MAG: ABC transporter ATP-binding protein, partial [Clostridia bacterium]|nr:ABC transporter ATP-binding protein [Clostridia bacterium]